MLRVIYVKVWLCYTGITLWYWRILWITFCYCCCSCFYFHFYIVIEKFVFYLLQIFFFSEIKFTYLLTYSLYLLTVASYTNHDISFSTDNIFSEKVEAIFEDLLLSKNKAISVGIVYGPPKDTNILQLFVEVPNLLNILENEIFVLSDININIF